MYVCMHSMSVCVRPMQSLQLELRLNGCVCIQAVLIPAAHDNIRSPYIRTYGMYVCALDRDEVVNKMV
jgi:hypothetical protein